MARGKDKRKTLVIDIITNKEYEFDSRFDACKFTGIERKSINTYMRKGGIYKKQYKFIDLYTEGE